jgi:hypothetical protein
MTPEWAYGITTIDPTTIRETAREMATLLLQSSFTRDVM